MKESMLNFMSTRRLCVISTVGTDAKPESAMVAYVHDGLELFIGTSNKSRKFQNLVSNPSVAIVIADFEGEVQYEGQARIITVENMSEAETVQLSRLSGFTKYRDDPSQVYIHIMPDWVRYIQHGEVDQVEEWSSF